MTEPQDLIEAHLSRGEPSGALLLLVLLSAGVIGVICAGVGVGLWFGFFS